MNRVVCGLLAGAAMPWACAADDGNLLHNPGFEAGATNWHLPAAFRVEDGGAHAGARCLRMENTNAMAYPLARQNFAFEPGMRYRYGAWVKTLGVRGEDSGATLCVEWTGAKGWLGGSYAEGRKGDQDWFRVEGVTAPVPKDAAKISVALYLRKGMTGTAWFDDVSVAAEWPAPLDAALLRPNYRGWILPGASNQTVRVRAVVADRMRDAPERAQLRLSCALIGPSGEPALSRTLAAPPPGTNDFAFDASPLPPGDYRARISLLGPGGRPIASREFAIRKWQADAALPGVYIDEHNRTIVGGKPFFPLGLYYGPGPTAKDFRDHIDRTAAGPFNAIMCYGVNSGNIGGVRAYLDYLEQKKLKIIYSIKDVYAGTKWHHEPVLGFRGEENIVTNVVQTFRDHPAVLGWYLNDELPPAMRDRLEARQRLVSTLDPGHPTWAVLYQVGELFGYLGTADVLGTDPYPVPSKPVTLAADWTRTTVGAASGHRPVWMVPQAFDWSHYGKGRPGRFPTRDELRVMTHLCLIHGANGLVYYCYHDLLREGPKFEEHWADLCAVGREVRALEPALLAAAAPPEIRVDAGSDAVHSSVRGGDDGRAWILLANTDPEKPARVRVRVPAQSKMSLMRNGERSSAGADGVELPPMSAAVVVVGE